MSPNNDHAARLRELAQQELDMAKTFTRMYSSGLIESCRADAAALLAGAEALEAVEAWRRYDAFGHDNAAWIGPEAKKSAETSKMLWAEFRAALARLVGK